MRRASIDEAIDGVVGSLTAGAPRRDLVASVVARIEGSQRARRRRMASWPPSRMLVAGMAAAVVALVIVPYAVRVGRSTPPAERRTAVLPPGDIVGLASPGGDPGSDAAVSTVVEVSMDAQRRRRISGARTPRDASAPVDLPDGLQPLESIEIAFIAVAQSPELPALGDRLEPLGPEAIAVEPLRLEALDPHRGVPRP